MVNGGLAGGRRGGSGVVGGEWRGVLWPYTRGMGWGGIPIPE